MEPPCYLRWGLLIAICLFLQACEFWEPDDDEYENLFGNYTLVSLETGGSNIIPDAPQASATFSIVEGARGQVIITYVTAPGERVNLIPNISVSTSA